MLYCHRFLTLIQNILVISVDFNEISLLLIKYFACVRYWRKRWEYNGIVYHTFTDVKKSMIQSKRKNLIQFHILNKLVRLIKSDCLNKTSSLYTQIFV
jgi:ribulose 1,5-bisphosphate carboxylase large subunit-like protein